jgi:hypothetical protein
MAAALTGKPVSLPEHPPSRKGGQPQKMIVQNRAIRLKSGSEAALSCRVFELPEAELIRQAVTEAAIIQAIGRARGVNRSAANPVEVYMILHDTTVPIAVDAVVRFEDLEPTKIDSMFERGLVPQWGADAAKLYPDLWPTAQAAQKAYRRAGLDVERIHARCRTSPPAGGARARCRTCPYKDIFIRTCTTPHFLLRYHPNGRGQKARVALVDQTRLAGAREQIEAALGSLASFEVLTGESDEDEP